jgi:hypothetical protein
VLKSPELKSVLPLFFRIMASVSRHQRRVPGGDVLPDICIGWPWHCRGAEFLWLCHFLQDSVPVQPQLPLVLDRASPQPANGDCCFFLSLSLLMSLLEHSTVVWDSCDSPGPRCRSSNLVLGAQNVHTLGHDVGLATWYLMLTMCTHWATM